MDQIDTIHTLRDLAVFKLQGLGGIMQVVLVVFRMMAQDGFMEMDHIKAAFKEGQIIVVTVAEWVYRDLHEMKFKNARLIKRNEPYKI